jgi:hypothetical protein
MDLRLLQPELAHGADARLLAYPETDPERDQSPTVAAGRAYSSSKLCNLLTARSFKRSRMRQNSAAGRSALCHPSQRPFSLARTVDSRPS